MFEEFAVFMQNHFLCYRENERCKIDVFPTPNYNLFPNSSVRFYVDRRSSNWDKVFVYHHRGVHTLRVQTATEKVAIGELSAQERIWWHGPEHSSEHTQMWRSEHARVQDQKPITVVKVIGMSLQSEASTCLRTRLTDPKGASSTQDFNAIVGIAMLPPSLRFPDHASMIAISEAGVVHTMLQTTDQSPFRALVNLLDVEIDRKKWIADLNVEVYLTGIEAALDPRSKAASSAVNEPNNGDNADPFGRVIDRILSLWREGHGKIMALLDDTLASDVKGSGYRTLGGYRPVQATRNSLPSFLEGDQGSDAALPKRLRDGWMEEAEYEVDVQEAAEHEEDRATEPDSVAVGSSMRSDRRSCWPDFTSRKSMEYMQDRSMELSSAYLGPLRRLKTAMTQRLQQLQLELEIQTRLRQDLYKLRLGEGPGNLSIVYSKMEEDMRDLTESLDILFRKFDGSYDFKRWMDVDIADMQENVARTENLLHQFNTSASQVNMTCIRTFICYRLQSMRTILHYPKTTLTLSFES